MPGRILHISVVRESLPGRSGSFCGGAALQRAARSQNQVCPALSPVYGRYAAGRDMQKGSRESDHRDPEIPGRPEPEDKGQLGDQTDWKARDSERRMATEERDVLVRYRRIQILKRCNDPERWRLSVSQEAGKKDGKRTVLHKTSVPEHKCPNRLE